MAELRDIALNILGPILLMILLGGVLRWRFQIDLATLTKLNIYLFVPAFVFDKVTTSSLRWEEMASVVAVTVVQSLLLGGIVYGLGRALRVGHKTLAALLLAVMFYNSGNYGIPLATLAYPPRSGERDAAAVQSFVLMTQNIMTFTVGLTIAGWAGTGQIGRGLLTLLRLPILPSLAAALLTRYLTGGVASRVPRLIAESSHYLADGLIPIALVTLGAQLASNPRWPRWRPVGVAMLLRLGYAPVQMAGLLWALSVAAEKLGGPGSVWGAMSLRPWPAELLVITAGTPTAVNTLLLTLELEGDAGLAADCVFWTTVMSALTLGFWLAVVRT